MLFKSNIILIFINSKIFSSAEQNFKNKKFREPITGFPERNNELIRRDW